MKHLLCAQTELLRYTFVHPVNGWRPEFSFMLSNVARWRRDQRHLFDTVTFFLTAHLGKVRPVRKEPWGWTPSPVVLWRLCVSWAAALSEAQDPRGKRQIWRVDNTVTTCSRGTFCAHALTHAHTKIKFISCQLRLRPPLFPSRVQNSQVRVQGRRLGFRTRCSRTFPPPPPAPPSVQEDSPQRGGGENFLQVREREAPGPAERLLLCCPRAVVPRQLPALQSLRVWSSGWWPGRLLAAPAQLQTPSAAADVAGSGWKTVCIPGWRSKERERVFLNFLNL